MKAGQSFDITITFETSLIADLTASGVQCEGKIYVENQPYFRFTKDNTVPSADREILATVDNTNKNILKVPVSAALSAQLPNYAADLFLEYKLTKVNGSVVKDVLKFETLEPVT